MHQAQWSAVDLFIESTLAPQDEALTDALAASTAAGLPAINVAPNQGKLLAILAQSIGASRILEIGTLGAYSTIWLARAIPASGQVVSLEANPAHAEVARTNLAAAGLAECTEIHVGPAIETLPTLAALNAPPFDLVFIDADKVNTLPYVEWALKLTRPGSLIIVDNVVRGGAILDEASDDPHTQGMRRFFAAMANEPRVTATALQTVGAKGYDGLALLLVNQT